jgi:hypothetical protein
MEAMKNLTKALVGTVAAGAMAVSTTTPALADSRDGGIGAGEVIAGALVIGGIAAVAAAASNNDGYRYGRDYRYGRGYGYGRGIRGMPPRQAVDSCVAAAQRNASRYGFGRANVTRVTDIDRKRDGYNVKGRIVVDSPYRGWRHRGYDEGKFTCKVRYGRIVDIDYSGIRGLR